ncbi:hypothetical protein [Natronococcus roseus]|uniref:hypothetical protein n=1 Tax=Natronococcus roseus TaxID=1052014 RepID=UPI00374DDFEF
MSSDRVQEIKNTILISPILSIGAGYFAWHFTSDISTILVMMVLWIAVTLLVVLWQLTSLIDERTLPQ